MKMEERQKQSLKKFEASAMDVEFLPLILVHKVHRDLKSSQVEIVPQPYYLKEPTPEPEPEVEGEMMVEIPAPQVVYAPPLPALRERKNWWDFTNPIYSFNNPRIRSRVELLMTSCIVHVTDRKYMVRLQERIKEDYAACLRKRMRDRAADEIEREKNLLLEGKITFEEAPIELKNHPVCRINQIAQRIMRRKRAKTKIIDKTWAYKTPAKRIKVAEKALGESIYERELEKHSESEHLSSTICVVDAESSEDIEKGLMFSREDFDRLRHEDQLIRLLKEIEAVNDLYDLADQIVGSTKTLAKNFAETNGFVLSEERKVPTM